MRHRHQVALIATALTVSGLGMFWYKAYRIGLPLAPHAETDVWTIEARVSFRPTGGPVQVVLTLIDSPPGFGLLNENFVSRGYGFQIEEVDAQRQAHWTVRRAGQKPQTLYYRAVVYRDGDTDRTGGDTVPPFPPVPELEEPYATAMTQLVASVRARSADIASFTAEMLRRLNAASSDDDVALFRDWMDAPSAKARTAQVLLAGARIPARVVNGVQLGDDFGDAPTMPWLEVHNGERWLRFDPDTGARYEPDNFLVWWHGTQPLISTQGVRDAQVQLSIRRNVVDSLEVVERRAMLVDSNVYRFSLFSLPLRTQAVYAVLLLVPIGALVMVIMRNLLGVPTFGTFTPVLIALAFRETSLVNGIVLFSLVVALGLTVRFYLEQLHLLLVPRLASVMLVVVLLLLGVSILSQALDLETGLSVALFPMVILTMVIERMSVVWEERGAGTAIVEGIGSLFVASVAYLAMSIDTLEHLMFVFPELLLVLLALCLLIGRYKGYRLAEVLRFHALYRKG